MSKIILWAPRVLASLIFAFLLVIAFGLFSQGRLPDEEKIPFLVSLIPAAIMLAGLVLGWKYKTAGGILIMVLGTAMTLFLRKYGDLVAFLPLATPVLVTGILFILSFLYEKASPQKKAFNDEKK